MNKVELTNREDIKKAKKIFKSNISWVNLSDEEIKKLEQPTACMYGKKDASKERN